MHWMDRGAFITELLNLVFGLLSALFAGLSELFLELNRDLYERS
ncbi:MAG: hypothetical protein QG656_2079 [Candidatus Hydrogenedentes bacterium]|nr:hypothetical protein [Candidatus Hydrogenedentota bacterium]